MANEAAILAFLAGLSFFFVLLLVAVYVYMSFAYMAVAKRAKLNNPGLAWIPIFGPIILMYQNSRMHWWPWLLIVGFFIPVINIVCMIAFGVFSVIWQWKLYEKVGRPGWWAILSLISVLHLILIGVAAWSDPQKYGRKK